MSSFRTEYMQLHFDMHLKLLRSHTVIKTSSHGWVDGVVVVEGLEGEIG